MDADTCKEQRQTTDAEVCDSFALDDACFVRASSSLTANYFLLAIRFWLVLLKRSNVDESKVFNFLRDNGIDWYSAKVCIHDYLINPTCCVPIKALFLTYLCVYKLMKENCDKNIHYNEFLLTFKRFKKYCLRHELSDKIHNASSNR